jgi:hypothetical protein
MASLELRSLDSDFSFAASRPASSNAPVNFVGARLPGESRRGKGLFVGLVIEGVAKRNKEIVGAQVYLLKGGIGYDLKRDLQVFGGYIIERTLCWKARKG